MKEYAIGQYLNEITDSKRNIPFTLPFISGTSDGKKVWKIGEPTRGINFKEDPAHYLLFEHGENVMSRVDKIKAIFIHPKTLVSLTSIIGKGATVNAIEKNTKWDMSSQSTVTVTKTERNKYTYEIDGIMYEAHQSFFKDYRRIIRILAAYLGATAGHNMFSVGQAMAQGARGAATHPNLGPMFIDANGEYIDDDDVRISPVVSGIGAGVGAGIVHKITTLINDNKVFIVKKVG